MEQTSPQNGEGRCLVIIPTYNEKENIEAIVRYVFGLSRPMHVLVIDDPCSCGRKNRMEMRCAEFRGSFSGSFF